MQLLIVTVLAALAATAPVKEARQAPSDGESFNRDVVNFLTVHSRHSQLCPDS